MILFPPSYKKQAQQFFEAYEPERIAICPSEKLTNLKNEENRKIDPVSQRMPASHIMKVEAAEKVSLPEFWRIEMATDPG